MLTMILKQWYIADIFCEMCWHHKSFQMHSKWHINFHDQGSTLQGIQGLKCYWFIIPLQPISRTFLSLWIVLYTMEYTNCWTKIVKVSILFVFPSVCSKSLGINLKSSDPISGGHLSHIKNCPSVKAKTHFLPIKIFFNQVFTVLTIEIPSKILILNCIIYADWLGWCLRFLQLRFAFPSHFHIIFSWCRWRAINGV